MNHAELRVLMSRALAVQHHFKFRNVEVIRCHKEDEDKNAAGAAGPFWFFPAEDLLR